MTSVNVLTFQETLKQSAGFKQRYLLLGNGFSMALLPGIFSYKRLFEEADFSERPHIENIFHSLNTYDFEVVIRNLLTGSNLIGLYNFNADQALSSLAKTMANDGEALKEILVRTISKKHPEKVSNVASEQYSACQEFLSNFSKVYTLNYDLLLYWAMLHDRGERTVELHIDDGFRNPDYAFGADYRVFDSPHSPKFFFIHGALHIFDAGEDVRKYTWVDTGIPLMEQIRKALDSGLFPLFVAEGSSSEKMTKINHSAYLSKALRSFDSICSQPKACLFVYGHSLDDSDKHILNRIEDGSIKEIFVSVYKGTDGTYSQQIIDKALSLGQQRLGNRPKVTLFDAASANVWGTTP